MTGFWDPVQGGAGCGSCQQRASFLVVRHGSEWGHHLPPLTGPSTTHCRGRPGPCSDDQTRSLISLCGRKAGASTQRTGFQSRRVYSITPFLCGLPAGHPTRPTQGGPPGRVGVPPPSGHKGKTSQHPGASQGGLGKEGPPKPPLHPRFLPSLPHREHEPAHHTLFPSVQKWV